MTEETVAVKPELGSKAEAESGSVNLRSSDGDILESQTSPLQFLWSILLTIGLCFFLFKIFGGLIGSKITTPAFKSVKSTDYGSGWPFPEHKIGTLKCRHEKFGGIKRPIITIILGGIEYGLNGAAKSKGGYVDARTAMAKSEWGTYKLGATNKIIKDGNKLCR